MKLRHNESWGFLRTKEEADELTNENDEDCSYQARQLVHDVTILKNTIHLFYLWSFLRHKSLHVTYQYNVSELGGEQGINASAGAN